MIEPESYFEKSDQRRHELAMAKAQQTDYSWIATAVGYASIAAVLSVAIITGFAQWLLTR